MLELTGFVA